MTQHFVALDIPRVAEALMQAAFEESLQSHLATASYRRILRERLQAVLMGYVVNLENPCTDEWKRGYQDGHRDGSNAGRPYPVSAGPEGDSPTLIPCGCGNAEWHAHDRIAADYGWVCRTCRTNWPCDVVSARGDH